MNDDLINRLRAVLTDDTYKHMLFKEAADALEAQAKRIAELEADAARYRWLRMMDYLILTDAQINRHAVLAKDCPPNSPVMLVSSIRRLTHRYAAAPAQP
jgi:hypothetical protein